MYYSLTFTVDGVSKNTWDDWNMIPNTPPMIPPPEPNTNYVEIPGRIGGPLDLSSAVFNRVTYKRMTGNWGFLRDPENKNTRKQLYEALVTYFTGRVGKVVLEEDPTHYYVGRFGISLPTTATGPIKLNISYDLMPIRFKVSNNKADMTYGDAFGAAQATPNIVITYNNQTNSLVIT